MEPTATGPKTGLQSTAWCRQIVSGSCLLLLTATGLPAAGEVGSGSAGTQPGFRRESFIGYRGDGSGVFPADCTPVTQWNEVKFRKEKYRHSNGQMLDRDAYDRDDPVNIVWKTPLDNYCNGGMIIAGGRLFQMVDRGGNAYSTRLVPDWIGAKLVCMDPADGKILWQEDCNHIDQLPEASRNQVAEDVLAANAYYVSTYPRFLRFRNTAGPIVGGGHGQPDYSGDKRPRDYAATYAAAAVEFAKVWPDVPKTADEFEALKTVKDNNRIWTWNYSQLGFGGFMQRFAPQEHKRRESLSKFGYTWNAWYALGSFVGSAMPTPISDGKRIFINTGYNDVFCYDLGGKRLWSAWYGHQGPSWGAYITSPVLVGKVLIIHGGNGQKDVWYRGIDTETGKLLWKVPYTGNQSYNAITPVPMGLKTAEGRDLDVIWTGSGNVFRVSDGKLLGKELGCHGDGRHVGVQGDIIVLNSGSADGGGAKPYTFPAGTVAMRLKATSGDAVTAEQLWCVPRGPERLVVRNGVVYGYVDRGALEARDLATGKVLASLAKPPFLPHHLSAIAGEYLFGLHNDGHCMVVKLGKDPLELVGVNTLALKHPEDQYFNEGSQPFFSGNRVFIRSYTAVYCLGDPAAPMQLSACHR
jgi:outer membrane protein assembly factor BamB